MANEKIEGGMVTVYYKGDEKVPAGPQRMFPVDANSAVASFPGQWSRKPWPEEPAPAPPVGAADESGSSPASDGAPESENGPAPASAPEPASPAPPPAIASQTKAVATAKPAK